MWLLRLIHNDLGINKMPFRYVLGNKMEWLTNSSIGNYEPIEDFLSKISAIELVDKFIQV